MVDRDALSSRLDALENYLAELRSFERYSREEFVREPALHHLGERFLHLACECILDIAHHVIAEQGYRQAASYKDTMDVLREEEIIDAALCERLKGWMGFRNVLVHFYLDIDHGRSFDALGELADLEAFAAAMAGFLSD